MIFFYILFPLFVVKYVNLSYCEIHNVLNMDNLQYTTLAIIYIVKPIW
jgi:hypothetical protein